MRFSRNIGLITIKQQEKIRQASVLVCGTGGMGGVCAEVLVRLGIGELCLVDPDIFELTNINRQIYADESSLGRFKIEVLRENFLKINPDLKIRCYPLGVTSKNVKEILNNISWVVNGMDELKASICLERAARSLKIPVVDAWLTPFASVFSMTPEEPHWEDFLEFETRSKTLSTLSPEDLNSSLKREVEYTLSHFDPETYLEKGLVDDVLSGKRKRPSLAPVVWLSGVLMANEIFKLIVGYPSVGYRGIFFDQYRMRLISGKNPKRKK